MTTQTSHVSSTYGRYIGRVGALATALGIGVMVVTSPGLASADPSDSSSTSTDASPAGAGSSTESTDTGTASTGATTSEGSSTSTPPSSAKSTSSGSQATSSAGASTTPSGATSSSTQVAPGVTISSSGGAHTSTSESEASTAHSTSTESPKDTNGVEAQPKSSESAASDETADSSQASTSTATPTPETATSETDKSTSTPAEIESDSTHSTTVDATATPSSSNKAKSTTASSTPTTSVAVVDPVMTVTQSSATVTASSVVPTANAVVARTASSAVATEAVTTAVAPTAPVSVPTVGVVGFLNGIVTNLLNPFLAPAPSAPEPFTPVIWAVLGWVRRNLFNQSPSIGDPTTTMQTGQTVTGNIGATDVEGDALTYTVTQGPQHGSLTIDQATGDYTYTPDDIDYEAAQTDSFTVSVSDGKANLLSLFGQSHSAQTSIDVTVLNPTVERVILNMPPGVTHPNTPRFAADGNSIYFSATPTAGGRAEIYQINVDGTNTQCITCGVSPNITVGLSRVVPYQDGSGRLMIQTATNPNGYVVYEDGVDGKLLVPVIAPPSGARTTDPLREMRISPDGTHVLFSQIQLTFPSGPATPFATAVPIVGTLTRTTNATTGAAEYHVDDARVVYPVGEGKQWTPDGKGVIILGGQYEAGNVDDIVVDLATGKVTRLTANLDYDEDTDLSPNEQWIAIGSTRGLDALTPMSRIVRPNFLPAYIQGAVYTAYAGPSDATNISNQEWALAIEDELKGENGIPLFAPDDDYTARSMASWNATGDAVAFWEASTSDAKQTRLVIANLKYTTSVGPVEGDLITPDPTWAPKLSTYVPSPAPLPPTGTYPGAGGGTAKVSEEPDPDPARAGYTVRTVEYTNYVNEEGMILNGTESTSTNAAQAVIRYKADIKVTGAHTGSLKGDVTINKLTRSITSTTPDSAITSVLDGDVLALLDPDRLADALESA